MKLKHVDYLSLSHAKNHSISRWTENSGRTLLRNIPMFILMKFSKGEWKWKKKKWGKWEILVLQGSENTGIPLPLDREPEKTRTAQGSQQPQDSAFWVPFVEENLLSCEQAAPSPKWGRPCFCFHKSNIQFWTLLGMLVMALWKSCASNWQNS